MKKIGVGDFRIGPEERAAIISVLDSNWVSEGKKVEQFEKEWAKYIGTKYSVVLNSGTSAIIAGLAALKYHGDLKGGKKVITTALTYIASANGITLGGYVPVFADIVDDGLTIDPEKVAEILEKEGGNCSVVLPVHIMGYPCDMDKLLAVAKKHGIVVFEDSAQAHGTVYKGKKTGSMGMLSDFSFYVAHNISAGEMGTINTNNDELIQLIRKVKSSGRVDNYPILKDKSSYALKDEFHPFFHDMVSYNFKATEFQAALASVELKRVDEIIRRRQENVKYLNEGIERFSTSLRLPEFSKDVSYLSYPLVLKNSKIPRKKIRAELEKRGIETRALFGAIPLHQPAYSHLKKQYEGKLKNAEYVGLNGFYIGCHQYLGREELDYVIKSFSEILR